MAIIDTHAHIYLDQFAQDEAKMIIRARQIGLEAIFLPNIDLKSIAPMLRLTEAYPNFCYALMGLHPCSVKEDYAAVLQQMKPLFAKHKFYGIGETGLDYHWDLTFKQQQQAALREQIQWAIEFDLPLILHTRKSFEETYEIVSEYKCEKLRGIFHCFSGSAADAKKVIDLGFYIGIGGVVTFKNSNLDNTVMATPLDKILIETDSPYLSPVPYRGKRNEPSYTKYVVGKIATIKNISMKEVELTTTAAAKTIYNLK